jgi:hypothetical protein
VGTTDTVKDNVYALAREAVNFFYEVPTLVINWDTAHVGKRPTPLAMNSYRTSPTRRGAQAAIAPGELRIVPWEMGLTPNGANVFA